MSKGGQSSRAVHPGPEVSRQAHPARQAPQQDRDHVRAPERLATHHHALRQVPEGLPLRRRSRGKRHVLAMTRERVLTLAKVQFGQSGHCSWPAA